MATTDCAFLKLLVEVVVSVGSSKTAGLALVLTCLEWHASVFLKFWL